MIGYILTKGFSVKAVVATPVPGRPLYLQVGKRFYHVEDVYEKASAAVAAGEAHVTRLRAELVRKDAELTRRAGVLRAARARLQQGD